ncbi:hypothetical protein C8J56DRAFT_837861 [Mycena floridula]|nr:hypothetical protein C8J56DRAFT_837861 [Mycena floridula]
MNSHTALLDSLDEIIAYALKLDLSGTRAVFFSHLVSLQTIIRFMAAQLNNDKVLQQMTAKLAAVSTNLDMKHLRWPFTSEEEQDIVMAITHIESQLKSAQKEPPSLSIHATETDSAAHSNARVTLTTSASGSSVNFRADHITGNIQGSFLSNNSIQFDADPAVHEGVYSLVEHAIVAETMRKRTAFLDWISNLDFEQTQIETISKHAVGTGEWFLQTKSFSDWLEGKSKLLWCPGNPGAGKTILSSIIINHLRTTMWRQDAAVIFIYCDYTRQAEQTATQLLGSILKQLVQHHPSISNDLLILHKTCLSQGIRPSVTDLISILRTEAMRYSHIYIVVDALDESSERHQTREVFFSTQFNHGLRSISEKVHVLITSRDIFSIGQEFQGEPRINIEAHNDDLQIYIMQRISNDTKLKRLIKGDTKLESEIVDQIILKAAGMFLQAQLHLDSLASQLNRRALHTALSSLPKGIMESYDAAMARISAQGEAEHKLALGVFYWLAYAQEPLGVKALQHAIAISEDMTDMDFDAVVDLDLLTGICAGLVVMKEASVPSDYDHEPIIQLVHYTAQEYFQLRQQLLFPGIHSFMTITCLTYLSFNVFESKVIPTTTWKKHPLHKYAARHWGEHALKEERAVVQHILRFLEKETNVAHAAHHWRGTVKWSTTGRAHILACFGLHQTLEILLDTHMVVDSWDKDGYTPLYYACRSGHASIVKILLERSADPNIRNPKDQSTHLPRITRCGQAAKPLLQLRDICLPLRRTSLGPLHCAIVRGHVHIVKLLLEYSHVDPNARDILNRNPLWFASRMGHLDIIKLLLSRNDLDPNYTSYDIFNKYSTLSYAAENGHLNIVQLLLKREDIDPNCLDRVKRTPLSYAAEKGHLNIVQLLLKREDIDPNCLDRVQRTPLSYAAEKGQTEIVKILLARPDINSNHVDMAQHTPLFYATKQGHTNTVKVLLEYRRP